MRDSTAYLDSGAGDVGEPTAPRRANRPIYPADASAGRVLRLALDDAAAMISENARAMLIDDAPGPPHQMRVGLRRARSVLWAGRHLMAPEEMRRLGERARDLGRIVGEARSLDVLRLETLPKLSGVVAESLGGDQPIVDLSARLQREARKRRKAARAPTTALEAASLALDIISIGRAAEAADAPEAAQARARKWARRALRKISRRVLAFPSAFDEMSVPTRHELRKSAKRLRYTIDNFLPLFPAETSEATLRAVRRLGNALGTLNDAADVAALAEIAPERRYAQTVAAFIAAADARAELDAPRAAERWRALQDAPRFWDKRRARM